MSSLRLAWSPREAPLTPSAVVATGEVARALGRRLVSLDDGALASLRAVAGDDLLIVLGGRDALPWVDGVAYLGREPGAPELLLPTTLTPNLPVPVLAHAVLRRVHPAPVAIIADSRFFVPCGDARPIDRARLAAWLAGRS